MVLDDGAHDNIKSVNGTALHITNHPLGPHPTLLSKFIQAHNELSRLK